MTHATLPQQDVTSFDPTRDLRYREARSARAVTDWLAYLELGGKAARTLDEYERSLSRMCLMFPDREVGDITSGDLSHLLRSIPPASRRARLAAINSFFKWAADVEELIDRNPCSRLPKIKGRPQRVPDVFGDAEVELLCDLPVRDGALMAILFDAGLRKGDALALQFKHYIPEALADAPHGKLVLLDGKGGKDRVLPATERVGQKLSDLAILDGLNRDDFLWYKTWRRGSFVRVNRRGQPSEPVLEKWWARCLEQAGVRYRNPHMARHTFATRWRRRGGRAETLQQMLGHESVQTTLDMYSHLDLVDVAHDLLLVQGDPIS